jgi:DNA-binding transcriptional LysR family regulator
VLLYGLAMLDVHRLRVFRSVVATGSINAAAANLGFTPSAISQHLAALQRETGLALVARAGRGIEPTAAGLALAAQIDGVLDRLGVVESLVAELRTGRTAALSIGYFASAGAAWMPTLVRTLLGEFPDLRLSLTLLDTMPVVPLQRPDIQVIVEQDGLDPGPTARAHLLLVEPYVAVLPRHHRLAGADAVELGALSTEDWVDNDSARGWCRQNLIEACHAAGFAPPFRVEAHDYRTAIAFVDAGIGITVLPRLAARGLPDGVVTIPVTTPTPRRVIYAVVQTAVEDTPPARLVLATLRACADVESVTP